MSAAEARRRMKADLQAQLDRITAQEEEERYSRQQAQQEQLRSYTAQSNAGSSYRASSASRTDVISPTWSQSQAQSQAQSQPQTHSQRNEWNSGDDRRNGSSSRLRDERANSQSQTQSHSAFRTMPDPVPMITSSHASGSNTAPWQRTGSSGTQAQARQPTTGPPTPDTPNMPNPLSASFVNIPVPSKHQLHEYLVNKQKQPLGLGMGWPIEGHVFDVYDLFVAVVRLGGSSTVSRREWWPTLAVMLGVPPSINTPHGLRASTEAARQLFAFFTLHLGTLETMWESTGSNEALGKGVTESRMRPPVSSARGDGEESRNQPGTYPPPPPQHRESSTSQFNRNSQYQPPTPLSSLSTSMPLHVHPSESSNTPALQLQQPPRKNLPSAKSRQQSSNGVNGTSFTRSQPGQAPSVSPVLHHPAPARLESEPAPITIDPRLIPIAKPPSSQGAAQSSQAAGSSTSKMIGMPPLSGYNPPKFASFDHLVATNALTLPKPPPNVVFNYTGTEPEIYAKRCFELRGVVKKIQAKEQARQVSKEEMTFWQKLLAILRHNPQVVIPGSQPMSTENVPQVPLPPSQQILDNATAGPSTAPDTIDGQPPKKKRGRKPKTAESATQPAPMEIGPNGELVPSTQEPPAKRRRGPGKAKLAKIAPAGPDTTGESSAIPDPTVPDTTTDTAMDPAADPTPTAAGSQAAAEGSSSQLPKPRKPYTIRVGPDGTPLSGRFKKRLESGNLGYVEIVHDTQGPSNYTGSQGDAGPSTLYAASADADALGEVDPDLDIARFEGPDGLAAFDAAIGYRDEDFDGEPTLSQLGGSSTGPGTNGHLGSNAETSTSGLAPNSAAKVKNPKRVAGSKLRWEQRRQEAAARLAAVDVSVAGVPSGVSTDKEGQKRGGFGVPGAATKAANKRWSLQHIAPASGSKSVFRPVSSSPMIISSPKRIISLSSAPTGENNTPSRSMGSDLLRQRAGSLKPRSSLPLHLTPSRKAMSPVDSQELEVNGSADEPMDVLWLPEPTDDGPSSDSKSKGATGKNKNVVNLSKQKAPRSSLPNHLVDPRLTRNMGPPLSTERPKASDKGKSVAQTPSTPEPLRFIQTRREKAGLPQVVMHQSRHSLPSQRASSATVSQPNPASVSPVRQSLLPSSQPRLRLVPEIELVTPRRYLRLSPVRPLPAKTEVSPIKVETRTKPKPLPAPAKIQPKPKPRHIIRTKPKPGPRGIPSSRKHVCVVLHIRKRRRADLIDKGIYDPFRDDDSDDGSRTKRYGHSGLRPKVALPRGSHARTAKPQAPETIVSRFVTRGVETELEERYRGILSESTILKRTSEQECGWKGCDAVLASEWHLKRHVELRRHAAQGIFKAGIYGETTLWRCHWEECEQPCFSSLKDLEQHLTARHISRVLECPYPDCDLLFSTLSHLTRHAVKHHDSPSDLPVPLADLSNHIPPPPFPDPPQHLPESARTDILTTPVVPGSIYSSSTRQEWCKLKVLNGCYAPDEPVLHIEHPPHILQPLGEGGDDVSEAGSVFTNLDGGAVTEERLLDESLGRPKRRLVPVVDLRVKKRSKVGTADDIVRDDVDGEANADADVEHEDGQNQVQDLAIDIETTTEVAGAADQPGPMLDDQGQSDVSKTQDNDLAPALLAEETHMDLGEPAALEDPIDNETTYSPLLGPRPDDILFSDDGDAENGDGHASESEVWAELEDQEMTQAFTPAAVPGGYDLSDDEDEDEEEDGGMDEDEDVRTEEIRAAILSDPLDSGDGTREADTQIDQEPTTESEEAALNGDVDMEALDPTSGPIAEKANEEVLDISKPTAAIASPELNGQTTNGLIVEQASTFTTKELQTGIIPVQTFTPKPAVPAVDTVKKFTVTVANRFAAIAEATSMDDEPASIEAEVGATVPEMRE